MNLSKNDLYQKNLALLKRRHPDLFAIISEYEADNDDSMKVETIIAKNGKPNLQVTLPDQEPFCIHDSQDPGKESEDFLAIVNNYSPGMAVLFGMGLGYNAIALARERKNLRHILLFERQVSFFVHAMAALDLSPVLTDKRVVFFLGTEYDLKEKIQPMQAAMMLEDIFPLKSLSCFRADDGYEGQYQKLFNLINALNMEGNTKRSYGQLFFDNRMAHLTSMHKDRRLEELKDCFAGVPAFIVAAGPSLDLNVDLLKDVQKKAVIISVDTVLPLLLNRQITPDFVSSIDYQFMTYEKISDTASIPEAGNINLICSSYVGQPVTKIFPSKEIYWTFNDTAFENWMNSLLGGNMITTGTSSVAHLNFVAAVALGCDPIVFVGQDLCWFGKKSHAAHTVLSTEIHSDIIQKQDIWVPATDGSKVAVERGWLEILRSFELMIENTDRTFINATAKGVDIKGAPHKPLEDVIKQWCTKDVDKTLLPAQDTVDIKDETKQILEKIQVLEEKVQKAGELGRIVEDQVKKFFSKQRGKTQSFQMLPLKLQKSINRLDRDYNLYDHDPLWPIFDDLTMNDLRFNERERQEIDALENNPAKYALWLTKSLERTWKVNEIRLKNLKNFRKKVSDLVDYYTKEKQFTADIEQAEGKEKETHILGLASLYYDTDNLRLLAKLLNRHGYNRDNPENLPAMAAFYQGVCALNRFEYDKADQYFALAGNTNAEKAADIARLIEKERKKLGDLYYNQALARAQMDSMNHPKQKIGIHMRLKGLKCCPDHQGLLKEFQNLSQKDQQKITDLLNESAAPSSDALAQIQVISERWITLLEAEPLVRKCIPKEIASDFYQIQIKVLLDQGQTEQARNVALQALILFPGNPSLYVSAADTSFALEDFDNGVGYLAKAVELDASFGVYWKNIGDNLRSTNDHAGAILAYERFLAALPQEIQVLRDIADCYMALDNPEAAREALQLLKDRIPRDQEIPGEP